LDGPLPKLCPVIPTSNQDGRQAKNRKKGDNLGTFWLKIEQFWPFEEIYIFSNGGHLGYRTALTDTILKGDHRRIIKKTFSSESTEPISTKLC
jgi:hypothetical protein